MSKGDREQETGNKRQGTRATDLGPSAISGVTLSHDFSSSLLVSKICHLHRCSVTAICTGALLPHLVTTVTTGWYGMLDFLCLLLGWLVVASRCLFAHCSHHQGTVTERGGTERGGDWVETLRASWALKKRLQPCVAIQNCMLVSSLYACMVK